MTRAARAGQLDGRPVVVLEADAAAVNRELLEQVIGAMNQKSRVPPALVLEMLDACTEVTEAAKTRELLDAFAPAVRGSGDGTDARSAGDAGAECISTTEAARIKGVTPEAMRKRCRLGQVDGARKTRRGDWLVPVKGLI